MEPSIAALATCGNINEPRKQKIQNLLLDWGYSPEWIESKYNDIERIDPSVIEKTASIFWREYRSYAKKSGSKLSGKNLDSIIKDLPQPDFLRDKMVNVADDLCSGEEIPSAQKDYIAKISEF